MSHPVQGESVSVPIRRVPELYDLKNLKGEIPVLQGAKAYQIQNFKCILGEDATPPAPTLHFEPMFFDITTTAHENNEVEITEAQWIQPDNIKI
jgi:hypothetical protein